MTTRKSKPTSSSEELGLKLLKSVREMKAGQFTRTTQVAVNEVVQARQGTGMSQTEFASALRFKSGSKGGALLRVRLRPLFGLRRAIPKSSGRRLCDTDGAVTGGTVMRHCELLP